jgi:hypothetical protein
MTYKGTMVKLKWMESTWFWLGMIAEFLMKASIDFVPCCADSWRI